MKILYLTYIDFDNNYHVGIKKKILGQIQGMLKNNHEVCLTYFKEKNFIFKNSKEEVVIATDNNKFKKIFQKYSRNLIEKIVQEKIEVIYIRYTFIDYFFIKFLKEIKRNKVKVYLEIPTYPYDLEIKKIKLAIELIYRRQLKKYVDYIILNSNLDKQEVYGIKTKIVDNGVSLDKIVDNNKVKCEKKIRLIAVSLLRKSNGYDRLIEGFKNYYNCLKQEVIVELNIIGEGPERKNLEQLVKKYKLENYVKFKGYKDGVELESMYLESDIAISSLGDHRVGIFEKSPLKNREYCLRGIPFITSVIDNSFVNEKYFLKISADDNPVIVEEIVEFYKKVLIDDKLFVEMKAYAEKNFSWEKKYENIF